MLHLAISHLIHLTREQCYQLHESQDIETIGISVPIWHTKTFSSEPAREVFCRYSIRNPKRELPIQITTSGYVINLPHRKASEMKPMTNEEWRALNMNSPEKLEEYYRQQRPEVSSINLLDIKNGGCQCIMYREHNRLKRGEKVLSVMHFVNIERMDKLIDSII